MNEAGGSRSERPGGPAPSELESVRREIVELGAKISRMEEKLEAAEAANEEKKVERLSSELKLLREKENLLHQEKLKLMDRRGAAEGQCRIAADAVVATTC